jgi:ribosome biogenesis GTPase A
MIDVTQEKIRVLQNSVEKTKDYVRQFCDIRDDIYSIQRAEWLQKISEMEKIINDEAILMFIGPFSSGKSSFVNALIGEDVLPTANTPCTAVVTEISFTEGGGDTGKIFRRNDPEKSEDVDYEELKKIINGPSGAAGEVASYHHVELCLDVTEKESRKQFTSFIGRIRIIDCPGFGSPYFANEDIINEYIEKSSFTFWMSPCNKIGGKETENYLRNIKKNTATLIPLITKSDLITDEDERESIKDSFYSQLSSFFKSREPHFISSFKFKEALEYEKKLQKENKPNDDKFEQLRIESGIDWVTSAMQDCATKKSSNMKKFESVLFDTRNMLKDLSDRAVAEKRHWQGKLEQLGWNSDEKKYEELDAIQDRTDRWIKEEAKKVSDNFRNELLQKLVTTANMKVDATEITTAWQNTIDKKKNEWITYIQNQYIDYIKNYTPFIQNDFTSLNATSFKSELVASFRNTFDSVLDSLRVAGPQSIITGSLGAVAIASTSTLAGIKVIGGALAAVTGIAGPALIAVALLPLIPVITKGIRDRKEIDKQKKENELRQYLNTINVAPLIEQILGKTHKDVYAYILKNLKSELSEPKGNYDTCCSIIEGIKEEQNNLNARFK